MTRPPLPRIAGRLVPGLAALALGCAEPDDPDAAGPLPPTWTRVERGTCDDPTEPAWTQERLAEPTGAAPNPAFFLDSGAIALVGDLVYWIDVDLSLHCTGLDGAERPLASTAALTPAILRLVVDDLDGDGTDDLLLSAADKADGDGMSLGVIWDAAHPDPDTPPTVLFAATELPRLVPDVLVLDVDHDGNNDLFTLYAPTVDGQTGTATPQPGEVFLGDGGGGFVPAGVPSGAADAAGATFDASRMDLDGDGTDELFVCNDGAGNASLWEDGDGGFVARPEPALWCMGVVAGDVNQDGQVDLYASDTYRHHLYEVEDGALVDVSEAFGLGDFVDDAASPEVQEMAWGAALTDVDNDADTDLLVAMSGFIQEDIAHHPYPLDAIDLSSGSTRHLAEDLHGRGLVATDLNGDGVPDLIVGDALQPPALLLSTGCTEGHFLDVDAPTGSLVIAEAGGTTWTLAVHHDAGYGAAGPARAHFGLGTAARVDRLTVHLPDGAVEVASDLPADARIIVP